MFYLGPTGSLLIIRGLTIIHLFWDIVVFLFCLIYIGQTVAFYSWCSLLSKTLYPYFAKTENYNCIKNLKIETWFFRQDFYPDKILDFQGYMVCELSAISKLGAVLFSGNIIVILVGLTSAVFISTNKPISNLTCVTLFCVYIEPVDVWVIQLLLFQWLPTFHYEVSSCQYLC